MCGNSVITASGTEQEGDTGRKDQDKWCILDKRKQKMKKYAIVARPDEVSERLEIGRAHV